MWKNTKDEVSDEYWEHSSDDGSQIPLIATQVSGQKEVVAIMDEQDLHRKPEASSIDKSTGTEGIVVGSRNEAIQSNNSQIQNPYAQCKQRAIPNGPYELIKYLDLSLNNIPWVIEAVVTKKTDIITHNSDTESRQSFYAILTDKSDYTIKALFHDSAVEKFHSLLCQGLCYTFCRGHIELGNPIYNNCKSSFEVISNLQSRIELVKDAVKGRMISKHLARNQNAEMPEDNIFENTMDTARIAKLQLPGKEGCPIFARVFRKHEYKVWSNQWSYGIRLSVDLIDSSGVDITANFLQTEATLFSEQLQEGKTYLFSGFEVKAANIKYKNTISDLEILVTDKTCIIDAPSSPDTSCLVYNFLTTKEIAVT